MSSGADPLPVVPDGFEPPDLRSPSDLQADPIEEFLDHLRATQDGITGTWFGANNTMLMTPRRVHHNSHLARVEQQTSLDRPRWNDWFAPWVWATVFIEGRPDRAELDFPRSAGGAFQYASRNNIQPKYRRNGDVVDESDVYAVVWTCRRLAVPGETVARVNYLPSDSGYQPGSRLARKLGVRNEERPLEDYYRELQFAGMLPEPAFERDAEVQYPESREN